MQYPRHIAIIPDGNRTWAKERGLPQIEGHLAGEKNSLVLLDHIFATTPVEVATMWGMSKQNLEKRSAEEINYLFEIYTLVLGEAAEIFAKYDINFTWVGNREGLPDHVLNSLSDMEKTHTYDTAKTCVAAINYGGRDEIIRGVKSFLADGKSAADLTAETLSTYLDFGRIPQVDLVIRTKGDVARRVSGFMSRWIGYAELYFTDLKYPDFTPAELDKALAWYDSVYTERNFGK